MSERYKQAINDLESKGCEFRNNVNKFIASKFDCCEDLQEEHKESDSEYFVHKPYLESHYLN